MEVLQESIEQNKGFLNHVFSTTEESTAELFNVVQYSTMGVLPVVVLNKLIHQFIPEADTDKSTIELLAEIFVQLSVMFCGIVIIHRAITYFPTYSGFKYENLTLTNVILAFLIIVLSIQTKLGIKVNILVDRALEAWNGESVKESFEDKKKVKKHVPKHNPSQADHLDDNNMQGNMFPPAPVATTQQSSTDSYDHMMPGNNQMMMNAGPVAANGMIGGNFGASF